MYKLGEKVQFHQFHSQEPESNQDVKVDVVKGNCERMKGDVYDFMLFSNPYIEIFLQEIKTFREKHKIIDVPFIPVPFIPLYSVPFIP